MDGEFQHAPFNALPLRRPDVLSVLTATRVPNATLCLVFIRSTDDRAPIVVAFDTRRSVSTLRRTLMSACERHWQHISNDDDDQILVAAYNWIIVPSLDIGAHGAALFREDTMNVLPVERALHGITPLARALHHTDAYTCVPAGSAPQGLCVQNAQRAAVALDSTTGAVNRRLRTSPTIGPVIRGILDVVTTVPPCSASDTSTCSCIFEYTARRARAGAIEVYALCAPRGVSISPQNSTINSHHMSNAIELQYAAQTLIRRIRGFILPSTSDTLNELPQYLRCAAMYAMYYNCRDDDDTDGENDEPSPNTSAQRLCAMHTRVILELISNTQLVDTLLWLDAPNSRANALVSIIAYIRARASLRTPHRPAFVVATQQQFAEIGWMTLLINELILELIQQPRHVNTWREYTLFEYDDNNNITPLLP